MDDLLWEVKYELKRTAKHVFYVLLAACWFAIWYGIFYLFIGEWDMRLWSDGILQIYFTLSIIIGFGYLMYRMDL